MKIENINLKIIHYFHRYILVSNKTKINYAISMYYMYFC